MTVRKNERKESMMEVQLKAIEIATYAFQKVSNEKVIPKRNRWSIGERILTASIDLCQHIDIANSMSLNNAREADERHLNQRLALSDTFRLMTLIDVVSRMHNIGDCYEFWAGLVMDEQNLLRGWIDSDKKRLKSMT